MLDCQKRMLVDLIESYFMELLNTGKSWGDHIIPPETWEKIASVVNAMGPHHKNALGWKLLYEKMKSETKEKVGAQRRYINKTGSGLPQDQLSDLDIKITSLCGKNHFDGLQGLSECGFPGRKFIFNLSLNAISGPALQSTQNKKIISVFNQTFFLFKESRSQSSSRGLVGSLNTFGNSLGNASTGMYNEIS